ncbi:Uncharacterised protein [Yersinia enterocolitica]|nr:Uncharacterised protein [Yersinia enterocolitica]
MRQDTGLGGDLKTADHIVQHVIQFLQQGQAVTGWIDANNRITAAIQQTI